MNLRHSFLLVTALVVVRCCAQDPKKQYVPALVGFYNIENLYDTIDSPDTDDHEFLPKGNVFSKDQIESYLDLKQEEQDRYRMTPHPVEFDMYYSC